MNKITATASTYDKTFCIINDYGIEAYINPETGVILRGEIEGENEVILHVESMKKIKGGFNSLDFSGLLSI